MNESAEAQTRRRGASRRRFLIAASALASSAVLGVACGTAQLAPPGTPGAKPLKALTFMAGYQAQADVSFVGVYVAHDLGYFKTQGLDVTIKHSSGNGEHAKLLAAKQVQVITETATSLVKNATGETPLPFISLAVLTQTGDNALATLKSSGIDSPKKFEGKTVGYKIAPTFDYLAMLKEAKVDRSKIREISVGFDVRILTAGKIDVLPVFKSNEPDLLRRMGFPVNVIDPADYGIDVMGQLWTTHRDLLAAEPDVYQRFVKAALKGLYYAFDNAKEATDIVMRYASTADRAHQEYMLSTEKESTLTAQTRQYGIGWQTVDQWSKLQDGFASFGLIVKKVDPQTYFDDAIQKSIYRNGTLIWP